MNVVVVGGGITGLTAAWRVQQARPDARLHVLEASDRWGGKIRAAEVGGVTVDVGPDSFLARVPWARQLCLDLGLADELVAPATGRAYIWVRGRLRPLPDGLVLGVPAGIAPLLRSGLLSPLGIARAGLDVLLPRRSRADDPSVADVVGGRLGREVVERLVEPLLGGIHAGRADRLSLRSVAPQIADVADRHRSLILGLRAQRRSAPPPSADPVFLSLTGGLHRLPEHLRARLADGGATLTTGTTVERLESLAGGGWRVSCSTGQPIHADAVVVAVPAHAATRLLAEVVPTAADGLRPVHHASVAVVTLSYPAGALDRKPDGSGFLVPRVEGRLMTACTFLDAKWPALVLPGRVLVRCSAGRLGDDRALQLDDDELATRLHGELTEAVGASARPLDVHVARWTDGFPQYEPGHAARVARIEAAVATRPGLVLAGAPYRGLGIAACVRDGNDAAVAVVRPAVHAG